MNVSMVIIVSAVKMRWKWKYLYIPFEFEQKIIRAYDAAETGIRF